MEQRYWMWSRRRFDGRQTPIGANRSYDESWEERAFADDSSGRLGGCVWPPRSYLCSFCRREFRSAQALGGHMNVHRRDRARLKQSPPPTTHIESNDPFNHHQTQVDLNPTPNPNLGVVAPHVNSFPPKSLASSPKQNSLEHFNFDRSSTKIHNDRKRSFLDTKDLRELELGGKILKLGDGVRYENFIEEDDAIISGKRQKTSATHSFFGSDSTDSDHLGSKVLASSNSPTEELDLELKLG